MPTLPTIGSVETLPSSSSSKHEENNRLKGVLNKFVGKNTNTI